MRTIPTVLFCFVAAAVSAACTIETHTHGSTASRQPAPSEGASAQAGADTDPAAGQPQAAARQPSPERRPATYTDSQGTEVRLETGAAAFADRVVSYEEGSPASRIEENRNPQDAVGAPDYDDGARTGFVTLGCGGTLTVEFTDVLLRNGDGTDLHVFEVGPDIEAVLVEISTDGSTWERVTVIEGQPASVDIAEVAAAGASYRFVRLTDQKDSCRSRWPGADIDALAVIGR